MKTIKFFVVLLGFISGTLSVNSQTDTTFWFCVPEANQAHGDRPVFVRFSALNNPAVVSISIPANPMVPPISVVVPANGTQGVDLTNWIDELENKPGDTVLNKGLYIHSSALISAYYEIVTGCQCNPEIFSLKGRNALGTRFFTPFQTYFNRSPGYYSTIDIVATENNTHVTITPSKSVLGHPAGIPYTILLQRGQTYSVQASGFNGVDNPNGTIIESDKPIAVTVKEDSVGGPGGCADILGDQIVPVDLVGTEYIVLKGNLNWGEAAYLLAVENNTSVYVNGNPIPAATLNTGQSFRHDVTGTAYINSSKPVYMYHVTGYGCELGSAILPSIQCTGSHQIGFTRSTSESFSLNLITRNGNQSNFVLNGNSSLISGGQFAIVPGTNGAWVSAQISFNTSQISVNTGQILSNSSGLFHLGLINGGATSGCRYGYFSDFSSVYLGPDKQLCQGDTAILDAGEGKMFYLWNTGDTTRFLHVSTQGTYWVSAGTPLCTSTDTIQISMSPQPVVNLGGDTTVCGGSSYTLTAPSGYASYLWNNQPGTNTYTVNTTGQVVLVVTSNGGCSSADSANILFSPPINNLGQGVALSLQDSLSAWFPFNGNAQDASGNNNHGVVHGAALTQDRFGNANSAFLFNGISDYIDVPNSPSLQINNSISLCAWMNFEPGGAMNPRILHKYNYQLATLTTTSQRKIFSQFGNNNASTIISKNLLPANNWHFVAMTFTGSQLTLYLNGNQDTTVNYTGNIGVTNYNLAIGTNSQNFLDWFKGKIDDIRIYRRALTGSEVQCLFTGSCSPLSVTLSPGTICNGATTTCQILNSQTGVQYQLLKNGVYFGSPQTGNGSTLTFPITGLSSTSGFSIEALNPSTACNIMLDTTLTVTVVPFVPSTSPDTAVCSGNSVVIQAFGGTGYIWSNGMTGSQITVSPIATTTYYVTVTNAAGCTGMDSVRVTLLPATLPVITGSASLCVNSGYYYYSTQTGMNNYQWTISPGATIIWGQGTPDLIVTWDQPGAQWIRVNYTNSSGCTAPNPTQLNVTVNPLPGIAGVITGPSTICASASGVSYSVGLVANAVTYVWSLPPGAAISGGFGTNSIAVDFSATAQPGTITVYGNNLCGNGTLSPALSVTLNPLPGSAGIPVGETMVCEGDTGITYYVPPVMNASSYFWEILGGAVITSGNGTNSVHVKYPAGTGNCTITVSGLNACGQGVASAPLAITVNPIPETPVITQSGEMLMSSAPSGNQWYLNGTAIPNATQQGFTPVQTGLYTVMVTLFGCESMVSDDFYYIMTSISGSSPLRTTLWPNPNDGNFRVSFSGLKPGLIKLSIVNSLGVTVFARDFWVNNAETVFHAEASDLPPGSYILVIQKDGDYEVKKLIILAEKSISR